MAKKLSNEGAKENTVIIAKQQTKGRGRYGRTISFSKQRSLFSVLY
jgi:biotin-(acetyl-CoA carboxylase) ligase